MTSFTCDIIYDFNTFHMSMTSYAYIIYYRIYQTYDITNLEHT